MISFNQSGYCVHFSTAMDMMFEAYLTNEVQLEPDDIPNTKEPVWILGKKYSAIDGMPLYLHFQCFIKSSKNIEAY